MIGWLIEGRALVNAFVYMFGNMPFDLTYLIMLVAMGSFCIALGDLESSGSIESKSTSLAYFVNTSLESIESSVLVCMRSTVRLNDSFALSKKNSAKGTKEKI